MHAEFEDRGVQMHVEKHACEGTPNTKNTKPSPSINLDPFPTTPNTKPSSSIYTRPLPPSLSLTQLTPQQPFPKMGSRLHSAVVVCRGWATKVPGHFRWATASLEELICEKKHKLKAAVDDEGGGVDPEASGGSEAGSNVAGRPDASNNTKFKGRVFVYLYSILLFNCTIILDSVSYADPIPKLVLIVDLASFLTGAIMILLLHSISPKSGFVKFVACCMTLMMIATGLSILVPEIAHPRAGNGKH